MNYEPIEEVCGMLTELIQKLNNPASNAPYWIAVDLMMANSILQAYMRKDYEEDQRPF